jgi:hypothetical protein
LAYKGEYAMIRYVATFIPHLQRSSDNKLLNSWVSNVRVFNGSRKMDVVSGHVSSKAVPTAINQNHNGGTFVLQ